MSKQLSDNHQESWKSRFGVILAVAGCAVGLGNFLRFPGQAAQFGGGAFIIAYFISLLILGLPIAWMEWSMGRYGGTRGFNSLPGILNCIWNHPIAKYIGAVGVVIPLLLYTYYSYVEAWCLGYAINFATGNINFSNIGDSAAFWQNFVGMDQNGSAFKLSIDKLAPFVIVVFAINFFLVYRGLSKGIEAFAKTAVPTLIVMAFIILIRVLTLGTPDPDQPENNVNNGLGFMWNPTKVVLQEYDYDNSKWSEGTELMGAQSIADKQNLAQSNPGRYRVKAITILTQLKHPRLWLSAASQVFFSLAVGFGCIMVYASYTKKEDDLVLSSLSAVSANEFCEVGLGGLIALPAAYAFLGAAGVLGQTTFGLGFNILPIVFANMPLSRFFGTLFFFLLFLASISGVLCMLQSGIAYFEEALNIKRKRAVALLGMLMVFGCSFVFWFSKDIKFMDTLDFWIGTFLIFVITTINLLIYGWALGINKGFDEMHQGAVIRVPKIFKFVTKYVCPVFLLTIFGMWVFLDVFGLGGSGIDHHILDLIGSEEVKASPVAWLAVLNIVLLAAFLCLLATGVKSYLFYHKKINH